MPDVFAIRSNFLTVPGVGHSCLLTAYDAPAQEARIRKVVRAGMTHIDLCCALNIGNNPLQQSRWRVNILKAPDVGRIVSACDYAHDRGLLVNGWLFMDNSKKWPDGRPVSIAEREDMVDAVAERLVARGKLDWLCLGLELNETLPDPDDVTRLGRRLHRKAGALRDRIATHYAKTLWTPHEAASDAQRRAWLRDNPWVRAIWYQFKKVEDGLPGFTTAPSTISESWRHLSSQARQVRPDLLVYAAEYVFRRPLAEAVRLGRHALRVGFPGFLNGGPPARAS